VALDSTQTAASGPPPSNASKTIVKNTLIMLLGQVIGTPLSMAVTAVMARYLGAADYGDIYVAGTMTTFGFLFVDWGQGAVMAGRIARERSMATELLGTSLAWRVLAGVLAYALLAGSSAVQGFTPHFQMILLLMTLASFMQSLTSGQLDAIRGLERADIAAYGQVANPLLSLVFVVPTLYFGGGMTGALVAQMAVTLAILLFVWVARQRIGVRPLRFKLETLRAFFGPGSAFLLFAIAMAMQPIVDALMLKRVVSADVIGWYAAARRLVGPLCVPASVLIGAMYPTLSRLHLEDRKAYLDTVRGALNATVILAFPLALCCGLYAEIGVAIYSKGAFGPARDDLVVLSVYLFLMYFTMPIGASILAAGKQKAWAAVQTLCVLCSVVLDPILIPLCQRRLGNGGIGVCLVSVVAELLVVIGGVWLSPKALFDRSFWRSLGRSCAAGAVMATVALGLRPLLNPFMAAPIALLSFVVTLWAVGGLTNEQLVAVRDLISRKLNRRAAR
jgi:O-antigen/teichoic acid export membrane protein